MNTDHTLSYFVSRIKVAKGINTRFPRRDFVSREDLQKVKNNIAYDIDEPRVPVIKPVCSFEQLSGEPLASSACILDNGKFVNFFVKDAGKKEQIGITTASLSGSELKEDNRWYVDVPHGDKLEKCCGIFSNSELTFLLTTRHEIFRKNIICCKNWMSKIYISAIRLNANSCYKTFSDVHVVTDRDVFENVHANLSSTNLFALVTSNKDCDNYQLRVFKVYDKGTTGISCQIMNTITFLRRYTDIDKVFFNQLGDKVIIASQQIFRVWPVQDISNHETRVVTGMQPCMVYNSIFDQEFLFFTVPLDARPSIRIWKVLLINENSKKTVSFDAFASFPFPEYEVGMVFNVFNFCDSYIILQKENMESKELHVLNPFKKDMRHTLSLSGTGANETEHPRLTSSGNWSGNEIIVKYRYLNKRNVFQVFSVKPEVARLNLFKLAATVVMETYSLDALRKMEMPYSIRKQLGDCTS